MALVAVDIKENIMCVFGRDSIIISPYIRIIIPLLYILISMMLMTANVMENIAVAAFRPCIGNQVLVQHDGLCA